MRILLTLVCAASLTFAACDSSDGGDSSSNDAGSTDTGNTGDTASDATTSDMTVSDAANTDSAAVDGGPVSDGAVVVDVPVSMDAGAPAEGACTNDADLAILWDENNDVAASTSTVAQACYLGGATEDAAYVACTSEGLMAETGLSAECTDCFVQNALCAKNNCLVVCLSDPVGCEECRDENGCTEDFFVCSGDISPPSE